MSDFIWFLITQSPSLLNIVKTVLYSIPIILIVVLIFTLSACSITHEQGHLPKLRIDTEYADDTSVKIRKNEIRLEMEWEI